MPKGYRKKMKIQYHSVKKNYKKLATRAISAGHLASYLNTIVLKEATTFAEKVLKFPR